MIVKKTKVMALVTCVLKKIAGVPFIVLITLFCGCANAQHDPEGTSKMGKRILIVYLSRTNNTKAIAEIIHSSVGGSLVALELEKPYPQDYKATVDQVAKENETGYLPPLKTKIDSIEQYEVVFVGFPTWGMQLPPPLKSFLHQYNLKGKTVIPFNTNGGYGIGSSFNTLKELVDGSRLLEGFSIEGGLERDGKYLVIKDGKKIEAQKKVQQWLRKIKML